jgi:hypothetical protein
LDSTAAAKFSEAAAKITSDLGQLLAFYDHPAEPGVNLRGSGSLMILLHWS